MKRFAVLALVLLLLCGCGAQKDMESAATDTILPPEPETYAETQATEPAGEGLIREPQEETEPSETAPVYRGQAAYSILENDNSIRNDSGEILVLIQYDQVILDTAEPLWDSINDAVLQDYQAFLEETGDLHNTPVSEWEARMESMGAVYGNFLCKYTPEITQNDGIFSICMMQEWFLGGVYTRDYYGTNFDLSTGKAVSLSQLSQLSEQDFAQQLKQIVCDTLTPDRDSLLEDPAAILEDYTLSDFSWCIEDGELILLFPTYTFGSGAMGPTVIKTGLYI